MSLLCRRRREFQLASEMHGKVMDVRGGNKDPGAHVIVYSKHSSPAKNQLWYLDQQGFIRSALNDFALDASKMFRRGDRENYWEQCPPKIESDESRKRKN